LSLLIPKIWSDAIMKQFMAGMSAPKGFRRVFEHPLEEYPIYKLVGPNNKFGGVYEYKISNKMLTGLMVSSETIGPTRVRVHSATLSPTTTENSGWWLVCWTKSIGTEEMKEALACLVMMGRTRYALIRSFGP
jgi:hypothetical protein